MYAATTKVIDSYLKYRYYLKLHDWTIIIQFCQCSLFHWKNSIVLREKSASESRKKLMEPNSSQAKK